MKLLRLAETCFHAGRQSCDECLQQASHGGYRGTTECWCSEDGGRSFRFAGYPAEPVDYVSQKDDMIDVALNGDLIDTITNYEKEPNGEIIRAPFISRSRDGGRTFERMSGDFTADGSRYGQT